MQTCGFLRSCVAALAFAALAPPAWAADTFEFAGAVTDVSAALLGGGVAVGDPVRLRFTLGAPVVDTDPATSVGAWTGALTSWRLDIGSLFLTGAGGDVQICDSPIPGLANCGSLISYPQFSGSFVGTDAVRFVGTVLTSPALVINGFTQGCGVQGGNSQCVTAAVYDASAMALNGTAIPQALDPAVFSFGTGRVPFGTSGQLTYSVTVVPEPSTATLMLAGLALAGAAAGAVRRRGGS
jgi:hypothetical protein